MSVPAGRAIHIGGIVQGVGFRPFVHGLATRLDLRGTVRNDPDGVHIRLMGPPERLDAFLQEVSTTPPPLSRIEEVVVEEIPHEEIDGFTIIATDGAGPRRVAITPDAGICPDCLRELFAPDDRRYRYPFINCTQCGPRYSVVTDLPYDRPQTTMAAFPLCDACRAEYETPTDRRYHAQATCCAVCGPRVWLSQPDGQEIPANDPIAEAAGRLLRGEVLAIKGLGGFQLACLATDDAAVLRLRERKHREEKPFAVMARDMEMARTLGAMPTWGERLLTGPSAPILIVPKVDVAPFAGSVAPGNGYIGVMLPTTPLHALLMADVNAPLVMTSGNLSDEPLAAENDEALARLGSMADAFLLHDRPIRTRLDDSVCMSGPAGPILIRRARGYAPSGIETGMDVDGILAVGPLLKNTFALGRGTTLFPSQHIGDLDTADAMALQHDVLATMEDLLGVTPRLVACDLHPDYPSTRLAQETGLPVVPVQHHIAHGLACMAEHREYSRSIVMAFDGTGYGPDGTLWGGEVFCLDPTHGTRRFHLAPIPQPGGDMAAREPWRMALSWLWANGVEWGRWIDAEQAPSVAALLESSIPVITTSSMGRLFDAVAALTGLCQTMRYEAKAPMALEAIAEVTPGDAYPVVIDGDIIQTGPWLRGVLDDLKAGATPSTISGRFHETLAQLILACATRIRDEDGLSCVYLTGGVMMNAVLLGRALCLLSEGGFTVPTHHLLPPNDGGVAVGQAIYAAANIPNPA